MYGNAQIILGDLISDQGVRNLTIRTEQNDSNMAFRGYKLLGDNIDKNIKARYIRTGSNHNISLHCFHMCAVQDRIDFNHLPNYHPDGCLNSPQKRALTLIPSIEDDNSLLHNFSILLSHFLCSNMRYFRFTFDGAIKWHTDHAYSKEMAKKSKTVSKIS